MSHYIQADCNSSLTQAKTTSNNSNTMVAMTASPINMSGPLSLKNYSNILPIILHPISSLSPLSLYSLSLIFYSYLLAIIHMDLRLGNCWLWPHLFLFIKILIILMASKLVRQVFFYLFQILALLWECFLIMVQML